VNLLLGVSGGIAAYKTPDLVRRLSERGFKVRVVMTPAAKQFVTPMALQAVTGEPVAMDLFDSEAEAGMGHIELARWAEVILIAPATANTLAKIVHGVADNLLLNVLLASKAPLVVAPAMNEKMWQAPATQRNLQALGERGIRVLGPASGEQACGDVGEGRMLEPLDIAQAMQAQWLQARRLKNTKVVITAGPTVEPIDPVRYISNYSSGKMGYALAEAARELGADVHLVSGPVRLNPPGNVHHHPVQTAQQMFDKVKALLADCDVFIGCAAVADYRPQQVAAQKIKKSDEEMIIRLIPNPDILAWVARQSPKPLVVGFAAESEHVKAHAQAKLERKKLDLICANDISQPDIGFNSEQNKLILIDNKGQVKELDKATKIELARQIMQDVANRLHD